MASARAEGARVLAGGCRPDDPELAEGYFYRPTVLDGCHRGMRVVREETFGPLLTVERFRTEDEAIALGNDTTYGLAGAVWSRDPGRAHRVAGGAAPRHGVDQRLRAVRPGGGVGRHEAVRQRPRAGSDRAARVPGAEAHLAQHGPGPRAVVHGLTGRGGRATSRAYRRPGTGKVRGNQAVRLHHRRRRVGGLRARQPAERGPVDAACWCSRPAGPTSAGTCSSTCRRR